MKLDIKTVCFLPVYLLAIRLNQEFQMLHSVLTTLQFWLLLFAYLFFFSFVYVQKLDEVLCVTTDEK